jgi:hypothetical protein
MDDRVVKTYQCWPCAFRFSETDSAWNTAIASGCCPNCGLALRDFPVAIKQQHEVSRSADPALTIIERRWEIFCVSILMALLTLIGGAKGSVYVLVWCYLAYMSYKGDINQIATWLKWLIIIHVVGLVIVVGFIDSTWLPGDKGFILVGAGITLAVKIALFGYVYAVHAKSKIHDNHSYSTVSVQQVAAIDASNDKGSNMCTTGAYNVMVEPAKKAAQNGDAMHVDDIDKFYEQALIELEAGQCVKATWARALAEANGDDAKSKAAYIRLRVAQLKAAHEAERAAKVEAEQKANAAAEAERTAKANAERLARLTEEQRAYELLPKGKCPQCKTIIPSASETCPKCGADFTHPQGWKVLPI